MKEETGGRICHRAHRGHRGRKRREEDWYTEDSKCTKGRRGEGFATEGGRDGGKDRYGEISGLHNWQLESGRWGDGEGIGRGRMHAFT